MGSCSLLQGIFPTQESNQGLLHYRQILYQLYQLSYQGSPHSPTKEATAVRDPRTAMKSSHTHPSGESGTRSNKDPAQPKINKLCKKEMRCACIINRRRRWQPTSVLLPGKSHGRRSLVGCSPWGREESDTTERLHFHVSLSCIGEGNGNHNRKQKNKLQINWSSYLPGGGAAPRLVNSVTQRWRLRTPAQCLGFVSKRIPLGAAQCLLQSLGHTLCFHTPCLQGECILGISQEICVC